MRSNLVKIVFLLIFFGVSWDNSGGLANMFSVNTENALVKINAVDREQLFERNGKVSLRQPLRSGQGVIIDSDGIIVTNKHIIGNDPRHIYVKLSNGKILEARIIKQCSSDLTLIKIDVPIGLSSLSFGDATQLVIGNKVIAYTNSNLNLERKRNGNIIQVYREASTNNVAILQMNITLNPGDSGGPVLNDQGQFIGLIMANQLSDHTKSYAIAANKIQEEYFKHR